MGLFPVGFVRDHRPDAPGLQMVPPVIGIIGFVREQVSSIRQARAQHDGSLDVGGLAWRQVEGQRTTIFVAYGVNLGVAASFGSANGLSRSPPFPPAAQRCALT